MASTRALLEVDPLCLPPGMQVGSWRILGWKGRGAYGTVYRVELVGHDHLGPFALKMAMLPGDKRFEREAWLLGRIRSPHVPRLHAQGVWMHPAGPFPYLIMDLIVTQKMKREREGRGQRDSPARLGAVVASLPRGCASLAHHHLCAR